MVDDQDIRDVELRLKQARMRELLEEATRLSAEIDAHLARATPTIAAETDSTQS